MKRYHAGRAPELQQSENTGLISGEAGGDGRGDLQYTSIRFPLRMEDEQDLRGSSRTSEDNMIRLRDWSELDLNEFASLLSQFRAGNERLSKLDCHTASYDLLVSSKIMNKSRRSLGGLDNIADVSHMEGLYKPLIERAHTRKQRLKSEMQKDFQVAEYSMDRLQRKHEFGSPHYWMLLPSHETPTSKLALVIIGDPSKLFQHYIS